MIPASIWFLSAATDYLIKHASRRGTTSRGNLTRSYKYPALFQNGPLKGQPGLALGGIGNKMKECKEMV
jgi:hypothetical protein